MGSPPLAQENSKNAKETGEKRSDFPGMRTTLMVFFLRLVASSAIALPETVMITYRPSAGNEAKLRQVIADHWTTATKLGLVAPVPHVVVRNGATLVEIFTGKTRRSRRRAARY